MKFFAAVFAALVAAVSANNHDECVCVSEATFEAHGFHTARDIVQKFGESGPAVPSIPVNHKDNSASFLEALFGKSD